MNFVLNRISKKWILISLLLGILISIMQIIFSLPVVKEDTVYTKWLEIDPFSFVTIIFYIILPFLASIPAATIFKQDHDNGFLAKLQLTWSNKKIVLNYAFIAFIIGFLVIFLSLITNLLGWFLLVPNIKPDNLINNNLLIISQNTLFVNLYYLHPLLYALLSILWAAIWGGLFSMFTMGASLFIKNLFAALSAGLMLQIFLLIMNKIFILPNLVSYSPVDLAQLSSATANLDLNVTIEVLIVISVIDLILLKVGEKKLVD